ncbi:MAG: tRNA (5-methylaminomethyl-2-thiouridine)(34)-methyltransferase MnmD [Flavobacteriales bacterium]|nr:tRNA (5-methylaminomethyl-2-thiouridine)(34)-methyltransferase MnmD [Flavobacteriia bacterium]NCP06084.1 tRNA (5-methylaminomethyl-2-thiouridine)(34)-methyltransferase MnmD [Flavobacteriales bacterium]PIV94853.1 MAG: SAM-dependent methyltransferase [Flavobacteriaceae bacterium CG17_big_fil_post_rev_8_21_14_2_50_33_15]PIY10114.1 MAG: SAM-dependent methyltransferase [Flavobacteriaceae bacterium CG_4_10_14_3_um_filter_33_47]PJB18020.1 MAG: SAM-dependent methyltransferase [Flavobacteriaceae bact
MKRKIVITNDGSSTIFLPEWNEQYHSMHGAIQEAYHVFIKHGLHYFVEKHPNFKEPISILEIGFGTGLNTFISYLEAEKLNLTINYCGVEAFPVSLDEINQLNYIEELQAQDKAGLFRCLHDSEWETEQEISQNFKLTKQKKFFIDIVETNKYHLIYFDAFGARVQPELWTEPIFKIMCNALKTQGVLVTYSAKGSARRAMQTVGFTVEKLPGPPGKREMLRACKEARNIR